jgi:hypothetical protein
MGKYLDILRRAEAEGDQPSNSDGQAYDINDTNDKRGFGRLNRFCRTFSAIESRCPALVPAARWQQAIEDGRSFLAKWGRQAEALGWTARDLFGLHQPPAKPHPSYSRLSRNDHTGLVWLLDGRKVLALTAETAAIHNPSGSITTYRRHHKPALIVEAVAVGRRPTK